MEPVTVYFTRPRNEDEKNPLKLVQIVASVKGEVGICIKADGMFTRHLLKYLTTKKENVEKPNAAGN
jgi:hypothetical protein